MNNNTDLLKEYASLAGKEDEKSEARKTEILNYIKLNADDSDREEAKAFINQKMEQLQSEVLTLREQLAEEDYKLLPLRYIAQNYFGKSAACSLSVSMAQRFAVMFTRSIPSRKIFSIVPSRRLDNALALCS